MQTNPKSKTKRRSLLPRPVAVILPPIETQRRARPSPPSPVKANVQDPEQEAQWLSWTDQLADICLRPLSHTNEHDIEDPAAEKETLEQDAEKARTWEIMVSLAIEGMREPDRRVWLRDQRMQEKRDLMQEQCDRQRHMLDCVESFSDWSGPGEYVL
ncbi:hypothetical protein K438DRAFT_1971850 [Mycena galopus ATCC 62051]|nr:hypothetical protein K438DRAFT_1971850 [Mycena galopus ATCC 62051]